MDYHSTSVHLWCSYLHSLSTNISEKGVIMRECFNNITTSHVFNRFYVYDFILKIEAI